MRDVVERVAGLYCPQRHGAGQSHPGPQGHGALQGQALPSVRAAQRQLGAQVQVSSLFVFVIGISFHLR